MLRYGHGAGGMHIVGRYERWSYNPDADIAQYRAAASRSKTTTKAAVKSVLLSKEERTRRGIADMEKSLQRNKAQLAQTTDAAKREKLRTKIKNIEKNLMATRKKLAGKKTSNSTGKDEVKVKQVKPQPLSPANIAALGDKITIVSYDDCNKVARLLVSPAEKNPPVFRMLIGKKVGASCVYNGEKWALVEIVKPDGRMSSESMAALKSKSSQLDNKNALVKSHNPLNANKMTPERRFDMVVATAKMNGAKLKLFADANNVSVNELLLWRQKCIDACR